MSSSPVKTAVPTQWPQELRERYEPVRELGRGGFASVMLAKRSLPPPPEAAIETTATTTTQQPFYVAIKIVANPVRGTKSAILSRQHRKELAYGHREIDILQALSHPNIMKCLEFYDGGGGGEAEGNHHGSLAMVLSYSKGPTMEALLRLGGAFSCGFGRVVMAQVVDALTHLHDHAVVHRDIKPDNIIISGAFASQDEIWDNILPPDSGLGGPSVDYEALKQKWRVTLIDFGFARALSKEDVASPSRAVRKENLDASYHHRRQSVGLHKDHHQQNQGDHHSLDSSRNSLFGSFRGALDRSTSRLSIDWSRGRGDLDGSRGRGGGLDKSLSRLFHRQMSALGNRLYAAPEIINHVHEEHRDRPSINGADHMDRSTDDIMATLSNFVAEYGLLVDAYSLGCTFRYMMTGVPPHKSVKETLARQGSARKRFARWLSRKLSGGKDAAATNKSRQKRTKRYRALKELPGEVQRLIKGLTEPDEDKRTSVRSARRYPWIQEVLEDLDSSQSRTTRNNDHRSIKYLDLTKKKSSSAPVTPVAPASPIPPVQ